MKFITIGIIISIFFHMIILIICLNVITDHIQTSEIIILDYKSVSITPKVPEHKQETQSINIAKNEIRTISPKLLSEVQDANPQVEAIIKDTIVTDSLHRKSASEILTESLNFRIKKAMLKFRISDSILVKIDSTKSINIVMTMPDVGELGNPAERRDRVADDLYKRNMGQPKLVPLSDMIRQGIALLTKEKNEKQERLQFIPTESELDILRALWQKEKLTQLDIFSEMDSSSSLSICAEDLDHILTDMVSKKMLQRRQISPKNELMVATPLGAFPVEMSRLNRLNKVYEYESLIKREDMLRFLDAVLSQIQSGLDVGYANPTDTTALETSLKHKISKIVTR